MFNYIKNFIVKTVKFVLGLTALLVVVVVVSIFADTSTSTADREKIKELTQPKTETVVVKKEEVEKPKVLTVEDKINRAKGALAYQCTNAVKASALYPTKVDPDWGYDAKVWKDYSGTGVHRFLITRTGEMMNGFGNMVPYNAVCKLDWNSTTDSTTVIEFYLNNQLLVG